MLPIVIFTFVSTMTILIIYQVRRNKMIKEKANEHMKVIPNIALTNIEDGEKQVLKANHEKTIILNYFNTMRELCQYEVKDLIENKNLFNHAEIILVSSQQISKIEKFIKSYHLAEHNEVKIFQVNDEEFYKHFGSVSPPLTFVYDQTGNLIKHYSGQIGASIIAKDINEYYNNLEGGKY